MEKKRIPCVVGTQRTEAERHLALSLRVARKQLQVVERLLWLQWLALIVLVPTCIVLLSRI
nr:MAG TPA: hypothetical protein [Caudoviricetes sp.]